MSSEKKPLYVQIQDYFKEQILSKKLKENDKIMHESEIIKKFSVSRITVNQALTGLAREGWIYRVTRRGSFVAKVQNPDELSDALQENRLQGLQMTDPHQPHHEQVIKTKSSVRLIGLVMTGIDSVFAMRLVESMRQTIIAEGFELVVFFSNNSKKGERAAIQELIKMGVVGLLIYPIDEDMYNDEILMLKFGQLPFVLVGRYLPGVETHAVYSDNVLGAQLATSYLCELGHRDIAICSNSEMPSPTVKDRIEGYMNELSSRGAMINPAMMLADIDLKAMEIKEDHPFFRYIKSRQATAYLALNSNLGMVIHNTAKQVGLKIPEDISVVVFDNPSLGYEEDPFFTHINQFEERMGRDAANLLLDLLNRSDTDRNQEYKRIILEPCLMVFRSSGTVNIEWSKN